MLRLKFPFKPMSDGSSESIGVKFERLVQIMAQLRSPGGCPWDAEQTFDSIKPYTLEETYEVLDAIDQRDYVSLCEELGDLMLQAVFHAQMAEEEKRFSIADSLDAINEKLVRRHPHVFAGGDAKTPEQVLKRWNEIKADEKKARVDGPKGLLDGVPRSQPALAEAVQISKKAAGVGFEWPNLDDVVAKLHEELDELRQAEDQAGREGEVGDVLFTVVNIARWLKVDPEQALRTTNRKFRSRFQYVESEVAKRGRTLAESAKLHGVDEMEALWQEAKTRGPSNSGA
ncbi:MAG TPA: nucleoside triphosphate pyrophosphohydrolase [Bryobacteraceae bacterium]|nr:nucleoside triphosphate pyrophosphohydrolase [Bryobacteraceae bacterium]HPT24828.1 nucleoside triphosphate pyrophosphohydrolase [Bryobacteraceae bacterium]